MSNAPMSNAQSDLTTASPLTPTHGRQSTLRVFLRWMVSFAGFPLGGVAAIALTGPVDDLTAALTGGLATGAVLGAVQAWALGGNRPNPIAWIVATSLGLMVGLGLGASLVDFDTSLSALVIQGAVCGAFVGAAQAVVLMPRVGAVALAWPAALAAIWAAGWAITTSIGVQVDEQFTVFGSAGAVVATALTAVLPLHLNRRNNTEKSTS